MALLSVGSLEAAVGRYEAVAAARDTSHANAQTS